MRAWRLVKQKHLSHVLSGEGARLGGGRWNHPGTPVVYAGESLSLSVLEIFIHFARRDVVIARSLFAVPLEIPDDLTVLEVLPGDLRPGWNSSPPPDHTKDMGTSWAREGHSPVLKVPSALIPGEYNFVLNVAHPDFPGISTGTPLPFALDNRIWK